MADANYVIGFDVGGTRIKSGAVTPSGELLSPGVYPSGFSLAPEEILQVIQEDVRRIAAAQGAPPKAIGLGFPGAVDPQRGVVLLPGKLQLEGFPIVPELQEALGIPVVAENDGRCSILAESRYGLARDYRWAVTITLGTGVGSGVMLDGKILRDPHLQFGTQVSHLVQDAKSGRLCITGARGTADLLCSATELATMVRDELQRGLQSVLSDAYLDNPHSIDFKAVIDGVEQNDAALPRRPRPLDHEPQLVPGERGPPLRARNHHPQRRRHQRRPSLPRTGPDPREPATSSATQRERASPSSSPN